jgi:VanZ family protein
MTTIARLRERSVSIALACLVVSSVAVVSFLPAGDKRRLHTAGRFHSLGHLLVFSFVAFVVARTTHSSRARVILFLALLALGFGIEYGEHSLFGNPLEWKDVLVDTLGAVSGTLAAVVSQPEDRN